MTQSIPPKLAQYAYSYVRFSSPEQMTGDSVRRQTSLAAAYAAEFSLILDDQLTYKDFGISSFRGQNAASGRLGDFLAAVSAGIVPQGSLLLVENLDRLSRESALNAQNLLTQIVLAGVTVVTLSDRRTYSIDELRRDPMGLIYALINFIRANEESELKSIRGKANWSAKRSIAEFEPITSRCPQWLKLDKDNKVFSLVPARVDIVQKIFLLAQRGESNTTIAKRFNRDKVPTWKLGSHWTRDMIGWIVRSSAVVGTFVPHYVEWKDGRKSRVPCKPLRNYYPSIISIESFRKVQTVRLNSNWCGHGNVNNILNLLAVCEMCGDLMVVSPLASVGPIIICSASAAGTASHYLPIAYGPVEARLRRGLPAILRAHDISAIGYGRSAVLRTAQNNVDRARRESFDAYLHAASPSVLENMHNNLGLAEEELLDAVECYQHRVTAILEGQIAAVLECGSVDLLTTNEARLLNKLMISLFSKICVESKSGSINIYPKRGDVIRLNV